MPQPPRGEVIGHRPEEQARSRENDETALETGVALEVNGLPDRLDLDGSHVRTVVEAGVSIVCASNSHSTDGLDNMHYAVHTARRGNAARTDVLNTEPLDSLLRRDGRRAERRSRSDAKAAAVRPDGRRFPENQLRRRSAATRAVPDACQR